MKFVERRRAHGKTDSLPEDREFWDCILAGEVPEMAGVALDICWPEDADTVYHGLGKEVLKKEYILHCRVEKAEEGETRDNYKQCPFDPSLECDMKAWNGLKKYGYTVAELKDLWYTLPEDCYYSKCYRIGPEFLRRMYNNESIRM